MTKPLKQIYDAGTNENIVREMTDEEYAQYLENNPEPTAE